jgi:glyoxylase-like metal-dependent hydrolase (beta-lactamase superfamily II)
LRAKIIHTPGHTPGGCCLYFEAERLLVAGDTLFAGSVGRTDFPGGDWDELQASLRKLKALPDDTRVVCGHGPMTTIGAEKRANPYFNE